MLSISKPIRVQGAAYYDFLGADDYYLKDDQPAGLWLGNGAGDFGLGGEVGKKEFSRLLDGFSANGKEKLVQNAGKRNRQGGLDLTFSAPKSVSLAWAFGDEKTRRLIESAHHRAVSAALSYLEDVAGWSRIGKGGEEVEKVKLTAAAFFHTTARSQDMQLHTHLVVISAARRADGSSGTIVTKPLFQHKMTAGALYRAELAAHLEHDLGLIAERQETSPKNRYFEKNFYAGTLFPKGSLAAHAFERVAAAFSSFASDLRKHLSATFEIKGVRGEVIRQFSKRREQIEASLSERGETGAIASQAATLRTRPKKEIVPRNELFERWHEEGRKIGFGERDVASLTQSPRPRRNFEKEETLAVARALSRATQGEAYFSQKDLVRLACEEAQGTGISGTRMIESVKRTLADKRLIQEVLPGKDGQKLYTTKEMLRVEEGLLSLARSSMREPLRLDFGKMFLEGLQSKIITKWKEATGQLSDEQADAVRHLTARGGGIRVVSGMAGTGKSTMLNAAREIWESQGFKVIGAALAGKAAEGLKRESGIKSTTVAGLLASIKGKWTKLDGRTVLVVDEAGMIGTRTMERLVSEAKKKGARLVLVGDERQLQPIEAGSPFKAIASIVGEVRLTSIRRQKEEWARQAVHDFADGNAARALREYAARGFLSIKGTRREAKHALIKDWRREGVQNPARNLILASTNAEVLELNRLAQDERRKALILRGEFTTVGENFIYEGDRVLFTRRSKELGVENGSFGTVDRIRNGILSATLDNGNSVEVPLQKYQDILLGYAVTTHKAQGITVDNARVLLGGPMQDREISYVQASRARNQTHLYVDKEKGGEDLAAIAATMARSREKKMALDLLPPREMEKDQFRYKHKLH